jgi:hypothetical protein
MGMTNLEIFMGDKIGSNKKSKHRKSNFQRTSQITENGAFAPNGIALRALTANVPKHKLIRDAESSNDDAAFDPAEHLRAKERD